MRKLVYDASPVVVLTHMLKLNALQVSIDYRVASTRAGNVAICSVNAGGSYIRTAEKKTSCSHPAEVFVISSAVTTPGGISLRLIVVLRNGQVQERLGHA